MKTKKQFEQVQDKFYSAIKEMEDILELMPLRADTSNACQRTAISNCLSELEQNIAGIELNDFISNEYSQDFKLSYSQE